MRRLRVTNKRYRSSCIHCWFCFVVLLEFSKENNTGEAKNYDTMQSYAQIFSHVSESLTISFRFYTLVLFSFFVFDVLFGIVFGYRCTRSCAYTDILNGKGQIEMRRRREKRCSSQTNQTLAKNGIICMKMMLTADEKCRRP